MKLNPLLTALAVLVILGAIGASVAFSLGRKKGLKEETWKDDEYSKYSEPMATDSEVPAPPETPEIPPEPPEMPPAPPKKPPMPPEMLPESEQDSDPVPPPPPEMSPPLPPGFEDLASDLAPEPEKVDSWYDLPDGGDYVQSDPQRYEGEECGTWVRQDDDSWVREN